VTKRLICFICLLLSLSGCCACPPHPTPWGEVDDLATDVVAWPTDSISTAELWASVSDSLYPREWLIDANVIAVKPPPAELLGPWPCRWIRLERTVLWTDSRVRKEEYVVRNGVAYIDETMPEIVPAILSYKTIADSVWHCGPDDGVFTR